MPERYVAAISFTRTEVSLRDAQIGRGLDHGLKPMASITSSLRDDVEHCGNSNARGRSGFEDSYGGGVDLRVTQADEDALSTAFLQ